MEVVPHSARETVEAVEGVHLTQLAVGERASVQFFHLEPGAVVPTHSHEHEQVGYITGGSGVFVVGEDEDPREGEAFPVSAGDSYHLESEEPHSLVNDTEESLDGIDVFAPPRANPDWME
jgi:quercetin dioxygenase-like cupin family protein